MFYRDDLGVVNSAYYKVPGVVNEGERIGKCDVEYFIIVVLGVELVARWRQCYSCENLGKQRVF